MATSNLWGLLARLLGRQARRPADNEQERGALVPATQRAAGQTPVKTTRAPQTEGFALLSKRIPAHRQALLLIGSGKPSTSYFRISIGVNEAGELEAKLNDPSDPSAIYPGLPVSGALGADASVAPPSYFPSYAGLTAEQRCIYLEWLQDVTQPVDIGYVFVYYYGLERQLLYGDLDGAVREIVLLRSHHSNSSFQTYSGTALVHGCMSRGRADILLGLYERGLFDYVGNSYLLFAHQQGIGLSGAVLLVLAGRIKGVNKRYLSADPASYLAAINAVLHEHFGESLYPLRERINAESLKPSGLPVFANYSLPADVRTPSQPDLLKDSGFQAAMLELFQQAHEKCKRQKAEIRKRARAIAVDHDPSPGNG